MLSLAEGHWADARKMLEDSVALAAVPRELLILRWAQTVLAEWDSLEGHPAQARARLEPLLDRSGEEEMAVTQLLPMLAWAHLDLGEIEIASSTIQQAKARAETRQMRPALSDALRVQALLCIRQQRWDEAQNALEEAQALCRKMPYPYAEAKALYMYGLLHQAKGEPVQALARLGAALTILNQLGERLYAEQVERALAKDRRP
jgi:tetratricopeptide (TPR) repeat protein